MAVAAMRRGAPRVLADEPDRYCGWAVLINPLGEPRRYGTFEGRRTWWSFDEAVEAFTEIARRNPEHARIVGLKVSFS